MGCAKEPVPGWVDNLLGLTGIMLGIGVGLIHTTLAYKEFVTDVLPVDYSVNLIIASALDCGTTNGKVKIFNCVSGPDAPITWSEYFFSELEKKVIVLI